MRFLPGNAQYIGARRSQQDSFGFANPGDETFIAHGGFLAIVCDGMGGMEYGDAASRTAVRAFLDAYRRKVPSESIPQALERSVYEANHQVLSLASSLGLIEGIGTTLVAAAVCDRAMYFVSVGDSGIFHASGSGLRMVNRPHVFANLLDAAVANGSMSAQDAANHPERESLTSYIGAQKLEEVDRNIDPLPLGDGDVVLLASDGLFKTLSIDEMRAACIGPPDTWPESLVRSTLAKKREYQDNVTVLSVAMESAAFRVTETIPGPTAAAAGKEEPAAIEPAKKPGMLVPLVVIIVLAIAGAAWWWFSNHRGLESRGAGEPGKGASEQRPAHPIAPPAASPQDVKPDRKEPK